MIKFWSKRVWIEHVCWDQACARFLHNTGKTIFFMWKPLLVYLLPHSFKMPPCLEASEEVTQSRCGIKPNKYAGHQSDKVKPHCGLLDDMVTARLGGSRVRTVDMCHRTVIFRILSATSAQETKNSMKTHDSAASGGFLLPVLVSCSPWTPGRCQLSVSGWEQEC